MTTLLQHLCTAAVLAGLAACQTTPPRNTALDSARATLSMARGDPAVARAAAVELGRAQQALQRAEGAWAERRDEEETDHLAYLAQRNAEIALAVARQAQAEEGLQRAGAERERLRLEARTREAEAATRAAQAARTAQQTAQDEAAREAERASALERDLKALQGRSTQRGMVLTLGDVLFASGRATLQPGAQRSAQQLAAVLRQYPERRVLVEGFTDSQGSEQANLALSQRRAEAFRQALVGAGVPAERIEVRGHGEAFPVASNATPAGRQQNRRVEVLFSDAQGRFMLR